MEWKQVQELKKEWDLVEQAVKVCEQFIVSISYEMCMFMNVIQGMSNFFIEILLNIEQFEYVDVIKWFLGLLLGIISDILDMFIIQNDKVAIICKFFSLGEFFCSFMSVLKYKVCEKQLKFELNIDVDVF